MFMQDDCKKKELMKILGQTIKRLRLEKSKSIYKISAESLMSKSTWREVELGICNDVTLSTLYKIADGLELPVYELLKQVQNELGDDFVITD